MLFKITTVLMLGVVWGISVILMKFAAKSGIDFFQIIFSSTIGVAVVLYCYQRFQNKQFKYHRRFLKFGLICAITAYLIPEYLSLLVLKHISAGLLSIVLTTVPIFTYTLALFTREDKLHQRKVAGLIIGFIAVLILLLSRNTFSVEQINTWLFLSFLISFSYAVYEVYASKKWPADYDPIDVAYGESVFVAVLALPFIIINFDLDKSLAAWDLGYWIIGLLILLWSSERILFFTAIKKGGAVYASQASYVSPPVSILLGMLLFDETFEIILWVCLAIILIAVTLISSIPK